MCRDWRPGLGYGGQLVAPCGARKVEGPSKRLVISQQRDMPPASAWLVPPGHDVDSLPSCSHVRI